MVSSSPFDLAKKKTNVRIQSRHKNSIKTMHRLKKKMERIRHFSDPAPAATPEESESPLESPARGSSIVYPRRTSSASASLSHGVVSVIGRKRTMVDAVKVVPGLEIGGFENYLDFFAVYSGRGGAAVCQNRMHLAVAMEAKRERNSIGRSSTAAGELCRGADYWNRVMSSSFQEMEEEIRDAAPAAAEEAEDRGGKSGRWWTTVVVMVGKEEIVVANYNTTTAGSDCRAVLYSGGVALPLSATPPCSGDAQNHKVKSLSFSKCNKRRNRENGFLHPHHVKFRPIMKRFRCFSIATTTTTTTTTTSTSTSTRLRRHFPKPNQSAAAKKTRKQGEDDMSWSLDRDVAGVIGDRDDDRHRPVKQEVTIRERGESSSEDEFVVIGSKGLWDVVSNELACDIVARCFNGGMRMRFADDTTENCAPAAAAFLAELAMARGSRDNVSVIVVKL